MRPENYHLPQISETGQICGDLAPLDTRTSRDALFKAIECADLGTVRGLIQRPDVDLSAVNSDGQTPIHAAIASGHRDVAMLILGHPHCSINALDRQGYTPLMLAVERCEWRLAKALVDRDATINVDSMESEKIKMANVHALVLMGAKGDLREAQRSALKIGLASFEALFAARHTALRNACERRDVINVTALMNDGVDASFVLMRLLDNPLSLSAVRGAAVRHLIASGVDLPAALAYAVAANSVSAVRAMLMLSRTQDIIGEMALMNAARELDMAGVSLLVASGVNINAVFVGLAEYQNEEAMKLMLRDPLINERLDVVMVLMDLAQDGNRHALKLLIDHGMSPVSALAELVRRGDQKAAKTLIRSGAEGVALLRSLAAGCADRPRQIDALRTLIRADADDAAQVLCEMAKDGKNLTAAKMLVMAGAEISEALACVAMIDHDALEDTLRTVRRDIMHTAQLMAGTGHNNVDLAVILTAAQDYVAGPKWNLYSMIVQMMLRDDDSHPSYDGDLLRALESVDWRAITELVERRPIAACDVLILLSRFEDCLPMARVLVSAGVSLQPATLDSVNNHDLGRLSFLLRAGCPESVLLSKMLEMDGGAPLAKELIQREHINVFKALDYLVMCGQQARLKHFIPAVTDGQQELIRALALDNMKLADALFKEQIDTRKVLVSAILTGEAAAAKRLALLGVDTAGALAQALAGKHDEVAQILLMWGADPSLALRDEAAVRDPEVAAQLVALVHDYN